MIMDGTKEIKKISIPEEMGKDYNTNLKKGLQAIDKACNCLKKKLTENEVVSLASNYWLLPDTGVILYKKERKCKFEDLNCEIEKKKLGEIGVKWRLVRWKEVTYISERGRFFYENRREVRVYDAHEGTVWEVEKSEEAYVVLAAPVFQKISEQSKHDVNWLEYCKQLVKLGFDNKNLFGDNYEKVQQCLGEYGDYLISNAKSKIVLDENRYMLKYEREFVEQLLLCDSLRASLDKYDETVLTDPQKGHWDLWNWEKGADKSKTNISLKKSLWSRNPCIDCLDNAVCAIDFGTSSTVVACLDKDERLLRIGKGNRSKKPTSYDYENPTIIELRDWRGFTDAYRAKDGRPETQWEQLRVSHQAKDKLGVESTESSQDYLRFFSDLKQWTNDSCGVCRHLVDGKGEIIDLPDFLELGDKDFNPIEIYAYYLGLYINNMTNKIYMQYVLSFPVKYSEEVREKIRLSFEKGIKKSLPQPVLNDNAKMDNFEVYYGASEPMAYAICALRELKVLPEENKPVYFAVFDFGGGTTDFSYGMMRLPEKDEDRGGYNYIVENFGSGGEVNLGGEKLLNLIAYEVYKDNLDNVRKGGIQIALPVDGQKFAGWEMLVNNTNSAFMNLKILSNRLRKLWEDPDDFKETSIKINLFGKDGKKITADLSISKKQVEEFVKSKIKAGIANFIETLWRAFEGKGMTKVHIFLAGNSCKSKYVEELLREQIKEQKDRYEKMFPNRDTDKIFKVHKPIGNQKNEADDTRRMDVVKNGKTGVAFGLLTCRKGGYDVKIVDRIMDISDGQAVFPYFLGRGGRNGEFIVCVGKDVEYGEWAEFMKLDKDVDRFEFCYTASMLAQVGELSLEQTGRKSCKIKYELGQYGGIVFLRKVDPKTVEYAVAETPQDLKDKKYLAKPVKIKLE